MAFFPTTYLPHKEAEVMIGWYLSLVPVVFRKQVCLLANFVECVVVDFILLRVIGPVDVLCVDWVMTILSSPLLTLQFEPF